MWVLFIEKINGVSFYGSSLNILERTLQTIQRKKKFMLDEQDSDQKVREQIQQNFLSMKEGDFKMPKGKNDIQSRMNKDQIMEEFGESDDEQQDYGVKNFASPESAKFSP